MNDPCRPCQRIECEIPDDLSYGLPDVLAPLPLPNLICNEEQCHTATCPPPNEEISVTECVAAGTHCVTMTNPTADQITAKRAELNAKALAEATALAEANLECVDSSCVRWDDVIWTVFGEAIEVVLTSQTQHDITAFTEIYGSGNGGQIRTGFENAFIHNGPECTIRVTAVITLLGAPFDPEYNVAKFTIFNFQSFTNDLLISSDIEGEGTHVREFTFPDTGGVDYYYGLTTSAISNTGGQGLAPPVGCRIILTIENI